MPAPRPRHVMSGHVHDPAAGQSLVPQRLFKTLALAAFACVLAACAAEPPRPETALAPAATLPAATPLPAAEGSPPSAASVELSRYYRRMQNDLLSQGLLRSDDGEADYPLTPEILARNFTRIALYDEYRVNAAGRLVAESRISRLRRWEGPIRLQSHFGAATPAAQIARDSASLAALSDRIRRATGLDIGPSNDTGNIHLLFVNEDERAQAVENLNLLVPGMARSSYEALRDMPRGTLCMAVAMTPPAGHGYIGAVIVIRSELPDALRLACLHEELAQAMGLANDDPQTRPTIFNDDSEFALLTRHDLLLLQILYDSRLQAGMTAAEAAPVAFQLATEALQPAVLASGEAPPPAAL